ncbi:hypothetical protein D3C85_747160 [compost metagenome]
MHPHIGEEHGVQHEGAADDGAAREHGVDGHAVLAVSVLHELGGGRHVLAGPDGPVLVIDVELGHHGGEIHVRLPEGVQGAHVAPVGFLPLLGPDAGDGEGVRKGLALPHDARDHVHAEVVFGLQVVDVLLQQLIEIFRIEDVDPHGSQGDLVIARHGGRVGRFLDEGADLALLVDVHHPEGGRLRTRHLDAGHRHLGAEAHVIEQHGGVVHLVDVIPRQHHYVFGAVVANDVDVLVDGIGGAAIPVHLVHPLLGRQQIDELVHLIAQEGPARLQVAQQAVGLVLGDHTHPANAGVDAVGEHEIDDAELAAEMDGGLGAIVGQLLQATTTSPCEHQGHTLIQ